MENLVKGTSHNINLLIHRVTKVKGKNISHKQIKRFGKILYTTVLLSTLLFLIFVQF